MIRGRRTPWLLSAVYFDDDGRNTALNIRWCPAQLLDHPAFINGFYYYSRTSIVVVSLNLYAL